MSNGMNLARLELSGFKSFAKKTVFDFTSPVVAIVGPNGSGKSNIAEAIRFVLGEQSMKSMRGKRGEDLIWNGSSSSSRMSRGAVSLVFDNTSHFLNVDFDEVAIERIVHRDGVNEYRMNGSHVRLKDIMEVMAVANIGQSGHHIISQGEADKILSASPRERKEMLEDALGLKVYQYKLEEARRKLEKTGENVRQVEALRREIAPHIRFLKKQVEKVEKVRELKASAVARFRAYFKREEAYVTSAKQEISQAIAAKKNELAGIVAKVLEAKQSLLGSDTEERAAKILELSGSLDDARVERAAAAKAAARLEGQIEIVEKTAEKANIPAAEIARLIDEGEAALAKGNREEALVTLFRGFIDKLRALMRFAEQGLGNLVSLRSERSALMEKEKMAEERERSLASALESIRTELDSARKKEREKERSLFEYAASEREVRHDVAAIEANLERLSLEEEEFKRELAEAGALFGKDILSYREEPTSEPADRAFQEREKRELEKTKIRLEEMGTAEGDEVMKEYQEISERESFLARELSDLSHAAASLESLIVNLEKELSVKFTNGIDAINSEFAALFSLMFDGGSASLIRVTEPARASAPAVLNGETDDEQEEKTPKAEFAEGIDISLSIPRKRIRSLVMLSGGERALTSIALIFAMSSVNPPPFLVLDETDAALDESNSRRYGDMVEALAKKSQLVLITHNRETMSRAGILYGITMGNDGVSKVLSVKLEEAVQVAK